MAWKSSLNRWLKFNVVGVAGAAVQLGVLWLCAQVLGIHYLLSTILAVESALIHNFAWHQAWTWKGLPPEGSWRRLMRFHLANGFVSLGSNALFTFLFTQYLGLPLLLSNLAAIVITAFLNFGLASAWVFRFAVVLMLALQPVRAPAAVFTTKMQDGAALAWGKYAERFERSDFTRRAMLDLRGEAPTLIDLNSGGDNERQEVPGGYIHHWIGAIRIPNVPLASVRAVLEDYTHYPQIYAPEVKLASEEKVDGTYDLQLVSEQMEGLVHFAFDVRSRVNFRIADGFTIVESRAYRIRESNRGRAPYTDLLPEGKDHGIVWRLNSYWRLRQVGTGVYAELQVISLSRKPLIGTYDLVKTRARDSLAATLRHTRDRAAALAR